MNIFFPLCSVMETSGHTLPFPQPQTAGPFQSPHHWGAFLVLGGQCVAGGAGGTSTQPIVVTLVPTHSVLLDFFVCLPFISPRKSLGWEWTHPDTQIFTDADICRHTHRHTYSHTQKHRHTQTPTGTHIQRHTHTEIHKYRHR